MLATTTDLESLGDWGVMEKISIHPIHDYSTDDEKSVQCLAVSIPILPDSNHLITFSNLLELRQIVKRMENGELRKEVRRMRREDLEGRAVEEATGTLRMEPPSSYPAIDSPTWDRFDLEGGTMP